MARKPIPDQIVDQPPPCKFIVSGGDEISADRKRSSAVHSEVHLPSRRYWEETLQEHPADYPISESYMSVAMAQQHVRNVLASLNVPTLGQPLALNHAKEGLFEDTGHVGAARRSFRQSWINKYVAWIKKHAAAK